MFALMKCFMTVPTIDSAVLKVGRYHVKPTAMQVRYTVITYILYGTH